jgi:hypothetical protein
MQLQKPYIDYQYKNTERLNELLNGIFTEFGKVSNGNLEEFLDIDKASGLWLDRLGLYLNYQRPYYYENAFGYDDASVGYDDENYGYDDLGRPVSDEVFRILIKAEIFRRNSSLTEEQLRTLLKFATNCYKVKFDSGVKELGISLYFETEEEAMNTIKTGFVNNKWFGLPTGVMLLFLFYFYPTIMNSQENPNRIIFDENSKRIWVSHFNLTEQVCRINPAFNILEYTSGTFGFGVKIISDGSFIYLLGTSTLFKINTTTNAVISSVSFGEVGFNARAMTYGNGYIWVNGDNDTNIYKINVNTMSVNAIIDIGYESGFDGDIFYYNDEDPEFPNIGIYITTKTKLIKINMANSVEWEEDLIGAGKIIAVNDITGARLLWTHKPTERKIVIFDVNSLLLEVNINDGRWLTPTYISSLKFHDGFVWAMDNTNKRLYKLQAGQSTFTIYPVEVFYFDVPCTDFAFEDDFLWLTAGSPNNFIKKIKYK